MIQWKCDSRSPIHDFCFTLVLSKKKAALGLLPQSGFLFLALETSPPSKRKANNRRGEFSEASQTEWKNAVQLRRRKFRQLCLAPYDFARPINNRILEFCL